MHKKKLKIIFWVCLLFFVFSALPAAAFEVSDYPTFGVLTAPQEGNLPSLIKYYFEIGTAMAGTIAAISFAVGAAQLIMAGSSPSLAKSGKDRMKGAVLGLLLTVASAVILNTINPEIAKVETTALPMTDGIYYTNGTDYQSASMSGNVSDIESDYRSIYYRCTSGANIYIWKFPKKNYAGNGDSGYEGITVAEKKCGQTESISSAGSFKIAYKTSGIYYFLESDCSGYMSEANSSSGVLSSPFKGAIKSIKIVNDLANDSRLGVVFHEPEDPTKAGVCSEPIILSVNKDEDCKEVSITANSVTVFYWNAKNTTASGAGITFYGEPFGWATGARSGSNFISAKTIGTNWTGNATALTLDYTGIIRTKNSSADKTFKNLYQNFQSRAGSIKIDGNYMLVLWSGNACQVFFKNAYNLKSSQITAEYGNLDAINIIPIK